MKIETFDGFCAICERLIPDLEVFHWEPGIGGICKDCQKEGGERK